MKINLSNNKDQQQLTTSEFISPISESRRSNIPTPV
jgi:hypothetical protein